MKLSRRGIFNLLPAALVREAAPTPRRCLFVSHAEMPTFDGSGLGFGNNGGSTFARFELPLSGHDRAYLDKLKTRCAHYSEREMEG